MSESTSRMARNLERFRQAVGAHDRMNPTHDPAYGIGVSFFDLERLGFEDGEQLWEGITIMVDGGTSSNFRVLCGLAHGEEPAKVEELVRTRAVGIEA